MGETGKLLGGAVVLGLTFSAVDKLRKISKRNSKRKNYRKIKCI